MYPRMALWIASLAMTAEARAHPSIQHLGIVRRLRRRLDGDGLDGAAIGLGAAVRRTLGDDDEIYENS